MRYSPVWCLLHTHYLIYIWSILSSSLWSSPAQERLALPSLPFTVRSWSISYSLSKLTVPPVSFHWLFPISLKSFPITTLWIGTPCCTAPQGTIDIILYVTGAPWRWARHRIKWMNNDEWEMELTKRCSDNPWRRAWHPTNILVRWVPSTEDPSRLQCLGSHSQARLKRLSTCTRTGGALPIFNYPLWQWLSGFIQWAHYHFLSSVNLLNTRVLGLKSNSERNFEFCIASA